MGNAVLKLDPRDNVLIALQDLPQGESITFSNHTYVLVSDIHAKHKFATEELAPGSDLIMYGVVVGKARQPIRMSEILTTRNISHAAAVYCEKSREYDWIPPHIDRWLQRTFLGYPRPDGQVGTRNYWLVINKDVADRFIQLMRDYAARAKAVRSGFDMNPSPGNIRDGLVTDAMKSAGAARKGGTSPVTAVLDYPEYSTRPGLNLQCTPGNDVECVTAQVGAGANVVLFTTGLGTPTGPVAPVLKISTNSDLARRMTDIIDLDPGNIMAGDKTIEQMGETILETVVKVASGEVRTKAEALGQDDFIPWKRGVSL
jgi:hypothetical protein